MHNMREYMNLVESTQATQFNNHIASGDYSQKFEMRLAADEVTAANQSGGESMNARWADDAKKRTKVANQVHARLEQFFVAANGDSMVFNSIDELMSTLQQHMPRSVKSVQRNVAELEQTYGPITWGESELTLSFLSGHPAGVGPNIRIEGKTENGEAIQWGYLSFHSKGAGQRFYRFQTNAKRKM